MIFFQGNNAHAVPVVPSLLGLSGFVPPGQMAGMHSYMLHPQGIPQSLASPNSGVPQFGTFQPTIQPTMHWPNQQVIYYTHKHFVYCIIVLLTVTLPSNFEMIPFI